MKRRKRGAHKHEERGQRKLGLACWRSVIRGGAFVVFLRARVSGEGARGKKWEEKGGSARALSTSIGGTGERRENVGAGDSRLAACGSAESGEREEAVWRGRS